MGLPSKKISRKGIVKELKAISRSRNPGACIVRLALVCTKLGKDWGMRIFWSSTGWEVELRSSYGLIEIYSHTNENLLAATKEVAKKLQEDIEDGSIHLSI